ncbi:Polysaccharide pyruvyl transferase [Pontibaca methylaminivorans]|uniref:Polysaccharide pyruvyl transferase n=2 Tax=Pontibaca methylaminivorans TaxID=515897 RepID=A0A1R3XC20_9RHOB|nr:Polysaccharide pyruvyl transferase [Pontibaca methylaminivorans]
MGITSHGREGARENTGNFLHGFAARHIIGEYRNLYPNKMTDEAVEQLRSELTHVVFVAATSIMVNDTTTLAKGHTKLANAIEKLGLPVVVFGLGAQARIGQSVSTAVVAPETKRLLSVLSHHSPKIAVRGEFTAELCKHLGIDNVEVIGCQSCFISRRPDFRMTELTAPPRTERTVVNLTRHSQELPLLLQAIEGGATYIGQSSHFEYEIARMAEGITPDNLPEDVKALMTEGVKRIVNSGALDFVGFHSYVRRKFFQYYSMEPWFERLRGGFDACIGTRFHGNMASMQSGVPSLWIVHDSRTQEFCDYLGLPQAPLQAVRDGLTIADLFDRYYETETFAKKYPANYARFYDYLTEHGVPHKLAMPLKN